jgi:murein DD-endopeptidase MepM/ murein hydrolase activator NlpD
LAKKKPVLAITLVTSTEKPPLRINLNRWVFGLGLIVTIVVVALASITLYNLLDGQSSRSRGDNLSLLNSSSTREQEQAKLIQLGQNRLLELQRDNDARKKDVAELEARVGELSNNLKNLQQLAREIEQKLPPGTLNNPGSAAPAPTARSGGLAGGNTAPKIDTAQIRSYTAQYTQALSDLENINKRLTNDKLNLATQDIQVGTFQQSFSAQKSSLDIQLGPSTNRPAVLAPAATAGTGFGLDSSGPPTGLPANCVLTSPFGWRDSPFVSGARQMHYGIDLGCFEGTPVTATKDGVVTHTGYDPGYGNRVDIAHQGGWLTLYGHNNRVLVKVGQNVHKGDIIALSGNTGASTGPHIHYEVHQKGTPIDPNTVLTVKLY